MRLTTLAAGLPLLFPSAALSQADAAAGGTLNPEELTLNRVMKDVAEGHTSMTICATGYYMTKSGRHAMARELFERCAAAGWTGAMTWMSQLDDNGLGGIEDPDAAAEWDRRAAEAGDPVGKLNYGLDLMRGRGVAEDRALGRRYVDDAARSGLPTAKRLQASDYDLDVVTPDADNWKYAPAF
ncbi:MAG TPA: sel1 repeat family protein [Shinella sp.]|jgi:hypothetical protein|uniref:tetratricopeptide repeat protein n=1 Tax=Shinella sp. TaxID=1870904 RepID=UPI002E10A7D5|nr:sel1 repeat family protein [Shinella sp.]